MFTFTPLAGAHTEASSIQSLLEFEGGVKILIDVGWSDAFDPAQLKELERQVATISIILLTHATISHLGAYAHCCKHIPLFARIPVYATTPVISLGRTLLQDLYASTPLAASFLPISELAEPSFSLPHHAGNTLDVLLPHPTPEEITGYFSTIHPLKYSQPHQPLPAPFSPPLEGLSITAYSAGHTLGGTIWHIQHASESVVYAVDWNQARENVLAGAAWLGGTGATGAEVIEQLRQPTALVCSSNGADTEALTGGWKKRDESLLRMIQSAISQGASILIPVDTSARVLELAYMLERAWSEDTVAAYQPAKLFLASRSGGATTKHARSMLEWMDEAVVRDFDNASTRRSQGQGNSQQQAPNAQPFDFKHLRLIERTSQLTQVLSKDGPKVFLASDCSLEWGFSRDILRHLCTDQKNTVILTDKLTSSKPVNHAGFVPSLRQVLVNALLIQDQQGTTMHFKQTVRLRTSQIHSLDSNALPLYQQYLVRQRQRFGAVATDNTTALETSADAVDDTSSSSSSSGDDSDGEHQGKLLNTSTTLGLSKSKIGLTDEELGINILLRRKTIHDYDVRGKRGREKVYPFMAKRRRNDDFGDFIRPEEYLRAEERDDTDLQDAKSSLQKKDAALGQKRRWDEKEDVSVNNSGAFANRKQHKNEIGLSSRRGQIGDEAMVGADEEEQSDASDYEPDEPAIPGPKSVTFGVETLNINLTLAYVDCSGLHDKRSLQMLIPLIKPRKLILTAGSTKETESLAKVCRQMLGTNKQENTEIDNSAVFTPTAGATIDASVDTNAWTLKLSRTLFKSLHWQNIRNLGLVSIDGQVVASPKTETLGEGHAQKRQKVLEDMSAETKSTDTSKEAKALPILTVLPARLIATTRSQAQSLHVGDLRLAELRKILQAQGHAAEFRGEGSLLIDGIVAVRKTGVGKIEVESAGSSMSFSPTQQYSSSFFNVKKRIYEGLAVVAAR